MVWQADLAIYYPYPATQPAWQIAATLLLPGAIPGFVLLQGQRLRYLPVGWFWYLITLFPLIGVLQVGFQSMANRYAYLPLVGIFIMVGSMIRLFLFFKSSCLIVPWTGR